MCGASSNGCAAGRTREDALLGGFLELVERDAVAGWWYNRIMRPAIDLDHGSSDRLAALVETIRRRNRTLHVLDLTTDLSIPVCVAIGIRASGVEPLFGAGCGPDTETAVWSALTEMTVHLFETEAGQAVKTVDYEPWMQAEGPSELQATRAPAGDPKEQIQDYARRAVGAGLDVLAIDLTRPETGVPVIRVISPGLRHWKPRFAPGRLYDLPVALRWRKRRLTVEELNPVPFPL